MINPTIVMFTEQPIVLFLCIHLIIYFWKTQLFIDNVTKLNRNYETPIRMFVVVQKGYVKDMLVNRSTCITQ